MAGVEFSLEAFAGSLGGSSGGEGVVSQGTKGTALTEELQVFVGGWLWWCNGAGDGR